jgi:hypothetical protein
VIADRRLEHQQHVAGLGLLPSLTAGASRHPA